jgi:predicted GH43/DUF377 family glycosyl hydrolase
MKYNIYIAIILSIAAIATIILILDRLIRSGFKLEIVRIKVDKHDGNPILEPRSQYDWEQNGTFNPAVVMDNDGHVHMLYRAIGGDGYSRIGHAKSKDGYKIDSRSNYPVFIGEPDEEEMANSDLKDQPVQNFDTSIYTSGGSWSGTEDPRAVVIDDTVYMTYTDFAGWNSVRIALTSISLEDLKNKRWVWKKAQFISPKNQVNKNWVLFPTKIGGKYAILHSISPDIKISYAENLDKFKLIDGKKIIKSIPPKGGRPKHWDNWVRGAGPPPLKTELGWLLLYHAMDKEDPNKYKLGAMILDLKNPEKILYRSSEPILEPEFHYENHSKPGVVYASGALIKNDELYIYYGGGDRHVCVAKTSLSNLLNHLENTGKVH